MRKTSAEETVKSKESYMEIIIGLGTGIKQGYNTSMQQKTKCRKKAFKMYSDARLQGLLVKFRDLLELGHIDRSSFLRYKGKMLSWQEAFRSLRNFLSRLKKSSKGLRGKIQRRFESGEEY